MATPRVLLYNYLSQTKGQFIRDPEKTLGENIFDGWEGTGCTSLRSRKEFLEILQFQVTKMEHTHYPSRIFIQASYKDVKSVLDIASTSARDS